MKLHPILLSLSLCGCTATSAQLAQTASDSFRLAACILSDVLGGDTDPLGIAGKCAGAAPAVIVDVIDDFAAPKPAANVFALSSGESTLLQKARANAVSALPAPK